MNQLTSKYHAPSELGNENSMLVLNKLAIKQKLLDDTNSISSNEYKVLLSGKMDPLFLYELNTLLNSNKLNPDHLLKEILSIAKNDDHLLLIAYCLRNNADPNRYISTNMEGQKDIHILVYIYMLYNKNSNKENQSTINEELFKNTIIIMFLLSGSNHNLSYEKSKYSLTVVQYLNKMNIKNILTNISCSNKWYTILDTKLLIKLTILLDKPELLSDLNNRIELPLIEIIRDHSINMFKKYINELLIQLKNDKSIEYCIKFANLKVFTILINFGIYPRYNEINIIILYIINQQGLIKETFIEFIREYTKRNGKLDVLQSNLLSIKIDDIRNIHDISIIGNELLSEDYKINYKDYIKKKYIGNKKHFGTDERFFIIGSCNKCIDVFNYKDILLTSDTFENILIDKKCPYNYEELSGDIVDKLSTRRSLLKRLGYKINKSNNNNLSSDDYYLKQEKALIQIIKMNCDKDITILPLGTIQKILISLGINIDLLNLLTFEHYRRTFYISTYEKLINDFDATIKLFI